eukprot:10254587-Alexandrium_andersonii.AAC.1
MATKASTGLGARIRARIEQHHGDGALRRARRQDPRAHIERPRGDERHGRARRHDSRPRVEQH